MQKKSLLYIIIDIILINAALLLAFRTRFGFEIPTDFSSHFALLFVFATIARMAAFFGFGIYKIIWRYAGMRDIVSLAGAISVGSTIIVTAVFFNRDLGYPRSVVLIDWFLNLLLVMGYRIFPFIRPHIRFQKPKLKGKNTLIIGAGEAGTTVVREMEKNPESGYIPMGFIDDDIHKLGMRIHGVEVLGKTETIKDLIKQLKIEQIVIAMPSASPSVIKKFVEICSSLVHLGVQYKIVPGIKEIIDGDVSIKHLREVEIEDLLGREPIDLDMQNISSYIKDKTILITGAGGSIGSELVRQSLKFGPKTLVLIGQGENSIYNMEMELQNYYPKKVSTNNVHIIPVIADVKNELKMEKVIEKYKPDVLVAMVLVALLGALLVAVVGCPPVTPPDTGTQVTPSPRPHVTPPVGNEMGNAMGASNAMGKPTANSMSNSMAKP